MLHDLLGEPLVVDQADGGEVVQGLVDVLALEARAKQSELELAPAPVAHAEQAKRPVLRRATWADRAFAV